MSHSDKWVQAAARIPPAWQNSVRELSDGARLTKYVWCVAVEALLRMPPDEVFERALQLQAEALRDFESFNLRAGRSVDAPPGDTPAKDSQPDAENDQPAGNHRG